MTDLAVGDPDDQDARIQKLVEEAKLAKTPEDLAKIVIRAGWGVVAGDPPLEQWPAFRAIVPILATRFKP